MAEFTPTENPPTHEMMSESDCILDEPNSLTELQNYQPACNDEIEILFERIGPDPLVQETQRPFEWQNLSRNQLEEYFLSLNRDLRDRINQLVYYIDQKLDMFCLKELGTSLKLGGSEETNQELTKKMSYSVAPFMIFKAPYIRDIRQLTSPQNRDTKQQIELSQLDSCSKLQKSNLWTQNAKKRLCDEVFTIYSNRHIANLLKQKDNIIKQLKTITGDANLEKIAVTTAGDSINQPTSSTIEELRRKLQLIEEQHEQVRCNLRPDIFIPEDREDKNIDWLGVGVKLNDLNQDSYSCRLMWKNQLHPAINKRTWTREEDAKLLELISIHGTNNWDIVARNLNTNRLPWQCCSRYQSELSHDDIVNSVMNEVELNRLNDIVQSCRIGDYIPWNQVMYFIEGRTIQQIKYQWHKFTSSHSRKLVPWNEYEDLALMIGVRLYGTDWVRISNFIPGRSNKSCRERHSMRLMYKKRSMGEWSPEEDAQLLMLAEKHDKNWSKVTEEMKFRNHHQARGRYYLLNKSSVNNSSMLSPRPKSKIHHTYDPFDYLLEATPRTVVISKLNLTQNKTRDKGGPLRRRIFEEFLNIIQRKLQLMHELSLSIEDTQPQLVPAKGDKRKNLDSECEDQLLEIFSAYSHVRPSKSLVCRSKQDEIIYQSLVSIIHQEILGLQESPDASCNLINFVLRDALDSRVTRARSCGDLVLFPPNVITIRGLRGLIMQQDYLKSIILNDDGSTGEASLDELISSDEYRQLRRVIISLFLWPMVLSNHKPPQIDSDRWASFVMRSIVDEKKNLYKIRDLQSKLTENK